MENLLSTNSWEQTLEQAREWLFRSLPAVLLVVFLALVLLRVVGIVVRRLKPRLVVGLAHDRQDEIGEIEKRVETLSGIVLALIRTVVWTVVLITVLRHIGIDIAPILAGAGIVGLAVGFGAQELVRDFLSGFFLLLENHVRQGDVVQVNGTGGLVEEVGLRTIVLRDLSGTVHVFQNGKIDRLANMTKGWSAMVFDIGVAYDTDTDHAVEVMRAVSEELRGDEELGPYIIDAMEIMGVDAFGASEIVIKARLKTKPIQQWTVGREYRRRLKKAFDAAGIEIPFPQRTVWMREERDEKQLSAT